MKKIFSLILILSLILCLCACGSGAYESGKGELSIVTTVFPAFDFARAIAGERASVCLLIPPGSESHSFEPTAQDILKIQNCDLFICNGGESEAWVEEILDGLDEGVNVLSMLDCVNALEEEIVEGMQSREEVGEEDEPEYDEHVWTSPLNAIEISKAICESLCAADSAHSEEYSFRCENYCGALKVLDDAFRAVVDNSQRRTVIFADRFPVRYFTEEYGLKYYAAFPGCADDAEPSAKTVAFLIDKVREENVRNVFYIEFSNEKMADVICEDTDCGKLLFHSCHNVSRDELINGVSYLELMYGNVNSLKEALS